MLTRTTGGSCSPLGPRRLVAIVVGLAAVALAGCGNSHIATTNKRHDKSAATHAAKKGPSTSSVSTSTSSTAATTTTARPSPLAFSFKIASVSVSAGSSGGDFTYAVQGQVSLATPASDTNGQTPPDVEISAPLSGSGTITNTTSGYTADSPPSFYAAVAYPSSGSICQDFKTVNFLGNNDQAFEVYSDTGADANLCFLALVNVVPSEQSLPANQTASFTLASSTNGTFIGLDEGGVATIVIRNTQKQMHRHISNIINTTVCKMLLLAVC